MITILGLKQSAKLWISGRRLYGYYLADAPRRFEAVFDD